MSTKFDLDSAIQHCEEVADRCAVTDGDLKCEQEHRQLAEWLRELKKYKALFGSPEEAEECLNGYMV